LRLVLISFSSHLRNARYFSGVLATILSGFVTYVFLEPLFEPVGLEVAMVALWILAINASMVGMALGVLLPLLFPGLCFGVMLSLLVGGLMQISEPLYLPVVGGGAALVGAVLSAK
jgi:callose synthase